MAPPLAQRQLILPLEGRTPATREDLLARYLHLRELSKWLHESILKSVSDDTLLDRARRLGLARGKTLLLEDPDEMSYIYDLAIYTGPADRSRAVERYANSVAFEAQTDERRMLKAMCDSQFAILMVERRHDTIGLIATDILRNAKVWLIDIGLERSMKDGELFATRLITPEAFSMTAGTNVPFEIEMLEPVCMMLPRRLAAGKLSQLAADRRFAEAVYQIGLADGVMDRLAYVEPGELLSSKRI